MNKTSILIAMSAVMSGIYGAKAGEIDFDGRSAGSIRSVNFAVSGAEIDQAIPVTPVPELGIVKGESLAKDVHARETATILQELDSNSRKKLAESGIAKSEHEILALLQNRGLRVLYSSSEVLFVEPKGKEVYNVVSGSRNPALIQHISNIKASPDNKNWILVCKEILEWVILIKEGVEVGQWVKQKVCEQEWASGPGEGGHIPPGAENQQRLVAFNK